VAMVDRMGEVRCEGLIISTQNIARNNRTAVVTAEFSKEFVQEIVSMRRLHEEL